MHWDWLKERIMFKQLACGFRITLVLTILTGVLYPGVVTAICQCFFRQNANGSLIMADGRIAGSRLIGQNFSKPEYFHPRPSAAGNGYDGSASSGSNLGPTSRKLIDRVKADTEKFRQENPDYHSPIPADMVTASGSGLDPDISPASALAQATRIAKMRRISPGEIQKLVESLTEGPEFGLLGDPRINVLELNIALDRKYPPVNH
jgi:potassium-transporting ATPase KdpC subunit